LPTRDGRFIEQLGSWNPLLPKDAERIKIDADRVRHWLGHGALPTDRVARFLDEAGITKREARSNPTKALPGKKAQERVAALKKAQDDAAAAIAAATAPAAEEAAAS
jgi:small subunit ribosomal protein S16